MNPTFKSALTLAATALVAAIPSAVAGAPTVRLFASLSGRAEVPGPGKLNASGSATVRVNRDQRRVCYSVTFRNIPGANMAHIHRGARGVAGPILVPLHRAGRSAFQGCTGVNRTLARDLVNRPSRYYVNVHSRAFPDGAARGQLHR